MIKISRFVYDIEKVTNCTAFNFDEGGVHYAYRIIWALYKADSWKNQGTQIKHQDASRETECGLVRTGSVKDQFDYLSKLRFCYRSSSGKCYFCYSLTPQRTAVNLELRHPRCVYNKMSRVRSVKHNYLLVTYNNMFRPTRRPSSG